MTTIEVTDEELELILSRRGTSPEYRAAMFERNYKGGNWFSEHPGKKKSGLGNDAKTDLPGVRDRMVRGFPQDPKVATSANEADD